MNAWQSGGGVFGQRESSWSGVSRGLRAGRCGSACTRGWTIREKKRKLRAGLDIHEHIAGGGVFGQWEHSWGGVHWGSKVGRCRSAGKQGRAIWAKKWKPSLRGSNFVNALRGVAYSGSGNAVGAGYARV